MPGKHAPDSSASFFLSLGRATGGALAAVGLVTALVLVLLNQNGGDSKAGPAIQTPRATRSGSPSPSPSATTPSPSPTATVLAPAKVTVAVRNGTARTGLAATTADRIRGAGYAVTTVGNASRVQKSTIFYRPDSRAEALAFQRRFPEFTVVRSSSQTGDAILRVVIGADFP